MRLKLLTVALALAATPFATHAEDLLDAYRQARANDPVLSQADSTRLATGENVVQARALLLPQISAQLSLNQNDPNGPSRSIVTDAAGNPVVDGAGNPVLTSDAGHTRTRQLGATISQSVLDLSRYSDLKAAKSSSQAQDATYEAALQQLATRVATAYFQVLTNDDALTFAKANEQALARQLEQAQQRFDVGLSAITDVQDAKAQHDTAVAAVITAENTLADSREALTQITGKPADNLKKLREQLPMDPPSPNDPKAWVAEAVKSNPTIIASQYNVDSAEHSISSARAGHLPTIDATLGYNKSTSWTQNAGTASSAGTLGSSNGRGATTVGLTLNVPIFAGGATQSRVRQSIYQRDAAQDSLESSRRQVVRDTLNYYRSVVAGISKVEATKAAVESSESARDATQAGFEVGTRTIVDVLIAQQNLTQALSDYSQARHQFILDKLLLKQTAGTVDVKDLEAINALLQ
ncbi:MULTISPECIES: TolC family outer membrane protein [Luteibacter]|uniref:TolC family outer membrane protein n=1 Tax=Luteibacter flocculans TaxID=2780091 RepID=A0ABY4T2J4_9GAMM|nr:MULTISPECIES: TolC family outer membrane protein [Luteibacter]URL58078.1 TolC family outer membrane protein [Luteibacter flocculans]SFW73545.1 outer membrane protein [Luteibacter sp. UNCMF366Tsu5.1]